MSDDGKGANWKRSSNRYVKAYMAVFAALDELLWAHECVRMYDRDVVDEVVTMVKKKAENYAPFERKPGDVILTRTGVGALTATFKRRRVGSNEELVEWMRENVAAVNAAVAKKEKKP